MPSASVPRPDRVEDYAGWERYHIAQAEQHAQAPAPGDLASRIGQLQGEMDHRAEALGYRELIEQQEQSYQAGRQFAADPSSGIGDGKPPHSFHLELFSQGANDYRKEQIVADREQETPGEESRNIAQAIVAEHIAERREVRLDPDVFEEQRAGIVATAAAVTAGTAAQAGAATSYYRGRADAYNELLDAAKVSNPELAKDLPAPLQVDEIRVRQVQQEQEKTEDRSLSLAR